MDFINTAACRRFDLAEYGRRERTGTSGAAAGQGKSSGPQNRPGLQRRRACDVRGELGSPQEGRVSGPEVLALQGVKPQRGAGVSLR